eukprot:360826-Chlamydomonas_euryale.AAC.4
MGFTGSCCLLPCETPSANSMGACTAAAAPQACCGTVARCPAASTDTSARCRLNVLQWRLAGSVAHSHSAF